MGRLHGQQDRQFRILSIFLWKHLKTMGFPMFVNKIEQLETDDGFWRIREMLRVLEQVQ